jgi:hypothetical protein
MGGFRGLIGGLSEMNCMENRIEGMSRMNWLAILSLGMVAWVGGAGLQAGEVFKLDVAALAEGPVPKEALFVVEGVWEVASKDGVKAVKILPEPITDANAQVGASAKGNASISARVFATKQARSYPRFGLSVHGMSGYRLMVNAPLKQIELVKGEEVVAKAPFVWTSDTWVNLKLAASRAGAEGPWTIAAFAWTEGNAPVEPQLRHVDESGMKGTGKCGLWGTPYSEQAIYFAEVAGEVETGG